MPINYQIKIKDKKSQSAQQEFLHNVSSGGLSFYTDQWLEPGSALHIQIQVQPPVFEADAIVVWCHKDGNGYQAGLQFNDSDVVYSMRMIEQICHIEQYKNEIYAKEGRKLTSEEAAKEWVSQFAADFPT